MNSWQLLFCNMTHRWPDPLVVHIPNICHSDNTRLSHSTGTHNHWLKPNPSTSILLFKIAPHRILSHVDWMLITIMLMTLADDHTQPSLFSSVAFSFIFAPSPTDSIVPPHPSHANRFDIWSPPHTYIPFLARLGNILIAISIRRVFFPSYHIIVVIHSSNTF